MNYRNQAALRVGISKVDIPQKVAANYFGQFVLLLAGHYYFGCGSKLE